MRSSDTKNVFNYFLVTLALAGCDAPPFGAASEGGEVGVSESAIVPTNCPGTRRVGFWNGTGPCPAQTDSWSGGAMFPGTAANEGELARYCMYDWIGVGNPTPGTVPGGVGWTAADCQVVAPFSHPFEDNNADKLLDAFHAQIQAVSPLPTLAVTPEPTKVVVVDSAIDEGFPDPSTGFLEHGQMMGLIVRDLGCPAQGPCLTSVASQLALPLKIVNGVVERDEAAGGKFGMMSDMARAIYDGFKAANGPGHDRIIVNLALGWAPEYGGSFVGANWQSLGPHMRAVYSTITWVACKGGIVVAAAGNHPGGASMTGAAYPAAWETKPAPGAIRCANLGGGAPIASTSTYRPLLYSASGVDALDQPLVNTRLAGNASLVAPAANIAIDNGVHNTQSYSGSSLAAGSATAIAAIVWSYDEYASPHDILDRVGDSGVELDFAPNYCLPGPSCRLLVRRLSLCNAVVEACAQNGGCVAATIPICPPSPEGRDERPTGMSFATPLPDASYDASMLAESTDPTPVEAHVTVYASPAIHPFPPDGLCPTCILQLNNSLLLGISNPESNDLSKPTLKVSFENDTKTYELIVDEVLLDADGATLEITNLPFLVTDVLQASIEFELNGSYGHSDQLLIEKLP